MRVVPSSAPHASMSSPAILTRHAWTGSIRPGSPEELVTRLADRRHPVMTRLGDVLVVAADPIRTATGAAVWDALDGRALTRDDGQPGWWIGLLGYDLGAEIERLPRPRPDDGGPPRAWLGGYDALAVFGDGEPYVVSAGPAPPDWMAVRRPDRADALRTGPWGSSLPAAEYRRRVDDVRGLIRAGDCYQVNIAQRLTARLAGGTTTFARRLWDAAGPTSHRAYLGLPGGVLISASPELLVRTRGGVALSMPIKGTAPPGRGAVLARSPKDRAEHVMIVDLVRNDLGRVARTGGVDVPALMAPLSAGYVEHLVSTVRGRLDDGTSAGDLVRAVFPGGSVTGCPKVRAMEVIRALEPVSRGPAFGSVVALGPAVPGGPGPVMEASILIRTAWVNHDEVRYWCGGAITWDSDPAAEHAEAMAKARPFLEALAS